MPDRAIVWVLSCDVGEEALPAVQFGANGMGAP